MGERFRETYGLLRFGARGPARGRSHDLVACLVPCPGSESVLIRWPHVGVDFYRNKQKNSTCKAQRAVAPRLTWFPQISGDKAGGPHLLRLGTHLCPHIQFCPGWTGRCGGSTVENFL